MTTYKEFMESSDYSDEITEEIYEILSNVRIDQPKVISKDNSQHFNKRKHNMNNFVKSYSYHTNSNDSIEIVSNDSSDCSCDSSSCD